MILWFVFFVVCAYLWIDDKKNKSQLGHLPGPRVYPFIGGGFELAFGSPADYFSTLSTWWDLYGTRFRVFLGRDIGVVLSDPKDVEVVLSGQEFIEKSEEYEFMKPWLGDGLLISTGEKWKKHRRALTPAFHFKILENFIQVFDAQSDIFVQKLTKLHADNMPFDIYPYITLCALDIICETAMGVSVNAQQNSESFYVNAVKDTCNIVNSRIRNPLTRMDFIFKFTEKYGILNKSLGILHGYTDTMIMQRRKLIEQSKEDLASYTESGDVYGAKKKMAFLDLLLLSTIDGKPLTDLEIREEVDTFLFEGHDTISSAIGFALHLLSNHPETQSKLYREQIDIFTENPSRPITHSDLQDMKYLELVIKETLRMYPSVPLMGRRVENSTYINDLKLPKGASIMILCYHMNRNPKVFPEPDKFIPERFLPEESSKRNPFSSVYFSAGPRNCIGQKFAMFEMKSTLSKLVRNFEIGPVNEPLELSADLILKSVNGIKIKLKPRTKTQ